MDASDRRKRAGSEAADWFARLQAGTMERDEREQFVEWLRESHIHVAELLRLSQIHGALAHFGRWERIATGRKTEADDIVQLLALPPDSAPTRSGASSEVSAEKPRGARRGLHLVAIAATVLLVIAAAVLIPQIRGEVIRTDRGERREVVLSDGSVLRMDPETRLRVKYGSTMRQVYLERGRALFRVAGNPARPFLVYADNTAVRALGTVFGVEHRLAGILVTVAEGKVAVTTQGSSHPQSSLVLSDSKVLSANQQVALTSAGSPGTVEEVDTQRALAWVEGRLIFQNDELQQVVAEFNRYNRVQLTVADPVLAAQPVSGVFNAADPEAFIAFLQSVAPVEIQRNGEVSITIATRRAHVGNPY